MAPSPFPDPRQPPPVAVLLAVALIAGAVTIFEIALTRIFSFTIWHHFASMVISVALLGFAVSGTLLQWRPALRHSALARAAWSALAFAVTSITAVWLLGHLAFDPTRIAVDPWQVVLLLLHYVVLLVPFTCAGLAIILLLDAHAGAAGTVYASDLAGAGLGCLAAVGALGWVGAEGVVWTCAAAAATSAALLHREDATPPRRRTAGWFAVPLALLASVPLASSLLAIQPGPGKALRDFLDRGRFPDARLVHTEWNAISRVDVVEGSGTVRWTANPYSGRRLPPQTQIVIDGDAATPMLAGDVPVASLEFLDEMLPAAALQAFRPRRVLVIGAGGGIDVLAALRSGAERIDAVEINAAIAALATRESSAGRPFQQPGVALHVDEGRAFVRASPDRFDLIQLSLVDTWAASASGAYSLAEAYLYTVEAFADYLSHLSDDGVLTITRWLWSPPRETLKLCTVAVAALRAQGVEQPENHVVVLSLGRLGSVLVKRSPFTPADLAALQQVAAARHFTFLYFPGAEGENEFVDFLRVADADAWAEAYPFDVFPATDDRPFFFQFGRWRDAVSFGPAWRESMLSLSGRLVLLATSIQALVLSLALLCLPLLRRRGAPAADAGGVILYFAAIGVSFMLLEVSLMQRFTLFLGHPVYAIACVLAVLLVSAGAGSATLGRVTGGGRRWWVPFAGIVALIAAYGALLPEVFHAALGQPLPLRIAIASALLVPLGFLLGVPFPAMVEELARRGATESLGWAWAANGCASVLGPLLAVLIAMDLGFSAVGWLAALGYAVACAAFARGRAARVGDA